MEKTNHIKKSRKTVILEEAARLFREKGYQATSMRDLAQRVELEPSSLYSHIKSKDELLQKICFDCADKFTSSMETVYRSDYPPLEKIRQLIEVHVTIALHHPTSTTVFNDEWKNLPGQKLVRFKEMRRDYKNKFVDILKDAQSLNEVVDIDPEILFNTMISSFRWIQPKKSVKDKWESEQIIRAITRFIMGGLTNQKYQLP